MKISEAISRIDSLKPNFIDTAEKVSWLSQLDGRFKAEVVDTREGADKVVFNGYDDTTPTNTELLIAYPYDKVYLTWLEANIDYTLGEYGRYKNSSEAFNTDYTAAINAYNRAHRSIRKEIKYF